MQFTSFGKLAKDKKGATTNDICDAPVFYRRKSTSEG